jgi:hypothetical protein
MKLPIERKSLVKKAVSDAAAIVLCFKYICDFLRLDYDLKTLTVKNDTAYEERKKFFKHTAKYRLNIQPAIVTNILIIKSLPLCFLCKSKGMKQMFYVTMWHLIAKRWISAGNI